MKKKIILAITAVVVILIVGLVFWINDSNKKSEEFVAFRELLDEEYFPILNESGDYFDTLIEHENDIGTYFVEEGFDVNLDLQNRLKEANDIIIKTDVKYEDTHALKQNILTTISDLEDLLDTLYTMSPSEYENEEIEVFYDMLSLGANDLSKQVDEMNEILGEYYE